MERKRGTALVHSFERKGIAAWNEIERRERPKEKRALKLEKLYEQKRGWSREGR